MNELVPHRDCVVVELLEQYSNVVTPDKQYATRTQGIVVVEPPYLDTRVLPVLVGKMVYFEEFKDGCQVEVDGKKYAFIKYEDIRGHSSVKTQ